jgi:hypothetical protein
MIDDMSMSAKKKRAIENVEYTPEILSPDPKDVLSVHFADESKKLAYQTEN